MSSPTYVYAIAPGDPITVVFDGTTPDLACDYQRLADNGNTVIVTTPVGALPENAVVNYIDDFQYFYKGSPPAQINVEPGDPVEVVITIRENNGNVTNSITGTIVAVNRDLGLIEVDDGLNLQVIRDWKYITKL
jgi:hypothetical protein